MLEHTDQVDLGAKPFRPNSAAGFLSRDLSPLPKRGGP